jgi:hypothetical protein
MENAMKRNPYARSLRVHRQQVIPDKREKTLRKLWNATLKEPVPPDLMKRLNDLQ